MLVPQDVGTIGGGDNDEDGGGGGGDNIRGGGGEAAVGGLLGKGVPQELSAKLSGAG